jgi:putative ABC transport system substrate-binding protein
MSRPFLSIALTLLSGLALLAALTAAAPARACDALVVKSADLKPYRDALRGFEDASACEVRVVQAENGDLPEQLRHGPPDVVVAIGTTAFRKVKALKDLPIVYLMVVSSEVDRALAPNISGVSMDIAPAASLETIKEVFPTAKRVGLLYDPRHTQTFADESMRAARTAGIELTARQVYEPSAIMAALGEMQGRMDVLWMLPDPTVAAEETVDYLLRFSIQHSLPIFTFSRKYVEMGAIASLDMDPYDMGVQAGGIADRVAAGSGALRAYARTARLSINAKAAKKMGLKIRDEVLKKAGKGE